MPVPPWILIRVFSLLMNIAVSRVSHRSSSGTSGVRNSGRPIRTCCGSFILIKMEDIVCRSCRSRFACCTGDLQTPSLSTIYRWKSLHWWRYPHYEKCRQSKTLKLVYQKVLRALAIWIKTTQKQVKVHAFTQLTGSLPGIRIIV